MQKQHRKNLLLTPHRAGRLAEPWKKEIPSPPRADAVLRGARQTHALSHGSISLQ